MGDDLYVKRFIPKDTDRFLYNPSCNNFQFFAAPCHVADAQPQSANHRSDLVAFCRPPELVSPQSSILLLVSATLIVSLKTLFQNNFFSKLTTTTRVAADSAAACKALQPLLILDVIGLFELELPLIS